MFGEGACREESSEKWKFESGFSMTLGSLFNLPETPFPQLENEHNIFCFIGCLWWLSAILNVKRSALCRVYKRCSANVHSPFEQTYLLPLIIQILLCLSSENFPAPLFSHAQLLTSLSCEHHWGPSCISLPFNLFLAVFCLKNFCHRETVFALNFLESTCYKLSSGGKAEPGWTIQGPKDQFPR